MKKRIRRNVTSKIVGSDKRQWRALGKLGAPPLADSLCVLYNGFDVISDILSTTVNHQNISSIFDVVSSVVTDA